MTTAIRIDAESDKFKVITVEAVPPTWRDVWAILRGRYVPRVRRVERTTAAGMNRMLRQVWSDSAVREYLGTKSPLLTREPDEAA